MMKIKPLGNRVLVKAIELETKTKSGIVIPDTASKDQPVYGEVLAVGDGDKVKNIVVKNKIIFSKYAGTEIKENNEKYLIINDSDVLALVE